MAWSEPIRGESLRQLLVISYHSFSLLMSTANLSPNTCSMWQRQRNLRAVVISQTSPRIPSFSRSCYLPKFFRQKITWIRMTYQDDLPNFLALLGTLNSPFVYAFPSCDPWIYTIADIPSRGLSGGKFPKLIDDYSFWTSCEMFPNDRAPRIISTGRLQYTDFSWTRMRIYANS